MLTAYPTSGEAAEAVSVIGNYFAGNTAGHAKAHVARALWVGQGFGQAQWAPDGELPALPLPSDAEAVALVKTHLAPGFATPAKLGDGQFLKNLPWDKFLAALPVLLKLLGAG